MLTLSYLYNIWSTNFIFIFSYIMIGYNPSGYSPFRTPNAIFSIKLVKVQPSL